jgi:hypothetical protein
MKEKKKIPSAGSGSQKEMHDMWVFLKKNFQCGSKVTDVISWPGKSYTAKKGNLDCELVVHSTATPLREMIFRQSYTRTLLCGMCLLSHNACAGFF